MSANVILNASGILRRQWPVKSFPLARISCVVPFFLSTFLSTSVRVRARACVFILFYSPLLPLAGTKFIFYFREVNRSRRGYRNAWILSCFFFSFSPFFPAAGVNLGICVRYEW